MPIVRCKDQSAQTLQEFYADTDEPQTKKMASAMLALIDRLNLFFKTTTIIGLTSLYRLVLLSDNTYTSPWQVIFASDGDDYFVDYRRYGNEDTELDITTALRASNIDDAVKVVLTAMRNSGGWTNLKEL